MGKRVYIHEHSFIALSMQSKDLAQNVGQALTFVRAGRVFAHHLIEAGLDVGLIRSELRPSITVALKDGFYRPMTELLCRLGYRPRRPECHAGFFPVLGVGESIVASCAESGYYTYATTRAAADLMFADDVPLRKLRRQSSTGSAPDDLTLIHGRSLALIDPVKGTGHTSGEKYNRDLRRITLSRTEVATYHTAAREEALSFLRLQTSTIAARNPLEDSEKSLLAGCVRSACYVLGSG